MIERESTSLVSLYSTISIAVIIFLNAFRRRTYKNTEGDENTDHIRDMKRLRDFIEKQCELIVVITDDVSEAFQFFDSQNARGKALYPHDLLKAYHLREMTELDADKIDRKRMGEDTPKRIGCIFRRLPVQAERMDKGKLGLQT